MSPRLYHELISPANLSVVRWKLERKKGAELQGLKLSPFRVL